MAARALSKLSAFLFPSKADADEGTGPDPGPGQPTLPLPTMLALHQSLLRLLQDDDEDVRLLAVDIVKEGLGLRRSPTQTRAAEIWWEWVNSYLTSSSVSEAEKVAWIKWLAELALYRTDLGTCSLTASVPIDPLMLSVCRADRGRGGPCRTLQCQKRRARRASPRRALRTREAQPLPRPAE